MTKKKKRPMTIEDFNECDIVNYMLGEQKGKPFIIILRTKKEPKFNAWPLLDDNECLECTQELIDELDERVIVL